MKDDRKKDNQLLLLDPEPEPRELLTVEEYNQETEKAFAQGKIAAANIYKEWKLLLPRLRRIHDFLAQRAINHVRGTKNSLPTWGDWLDQFIEVTGLDYSPRYVATLVVDYDPDNEDRDLVSGARREPARIASG